MTLGIFTIKEDNVRNDHANMQGQYRSNQTKKYDKVIIMIDFNRANRSLFEKEGLKLS